MLKLLIILFHLSPKIVEGISTQFDEYLPIISPDQEMAFFTRRSDKKSLESITVTTVEEFVSMSQKIDKVNLK